MSYNSPGLRPRACENRPRLWGCVLKLFFFDSGRPWGAWPTKDRSLDEVWAMFGLGPMMVTSFWTMLWLSWGRLFRGPKKGPQIYKFWGPKMEPNCAETNSKWVSAEPPSIEPRKTQKKAATGHAFSIRQPSKSMKFL